MINALLVSLANKTTGFSDPGLNVVQEFVKDTNYDDIRNILTDGTETKAVYLVQAVLHDPYVALQIPSGVSTVDVSGRKLLDVHITGANLIGNNAGPAYVSCTDVPLGSELQVAYNTDSTVSVKTSSKFEIVPVSVYADGKRLSIAWPTWTGVSGAIALEASYSPSTEFFISLCGKYPYESVCEVLEASGAFFELLLETSLENVYYSSYTYEQRAAIAVLALYKHFMSIQ